MVVRLQDPTPDRQPGTGSTLRCRPGHVVIGQPVEMHAGASPCLARFVFALLGSSLLVACSDDDAVEADGAVCDMVAEIGDGYRSGAGSEDPLGELGAAAGEQTEIARLAREMRDLSAHDRMSDTDADRFAELGRQLDDELASACPDLADHLAD